MRGGDQKFFAEVPGDWRRLIADIAAVLHFTLSEIDEMDLRELKAWHGEAVRIVKEMRRA